MAIGCRYGVLMIVILTKGFCSWCSSSTSSDINSNWGIGYNWVGLVMNNTTASTTTAHVKSTSTTTCYN